MPVLPTGCRPKWGDAVRALVAAVKDGRSGDGCVAAIERCSAVLAEHFPPAP